MSEQSGNDFSFGGVAEVDQLLATLASGETTTDQISRLDVLVCTDVRARRRFVRSLQLAALLEWGYVGGTLAQGTLRQTDGKKNSVKGAIDSSGLSDLEALVGQSSIEATNTLWIPSHQQASPPVKPKSPVLGFLALVQQRAGVVASPLTFMVLAALVALSAVTVVWITRGSPVAAKIVDRGDAHWKEANDELSTTQSMTVGQRLDLASGCLKVVFASGATITLEGPVSFRIDSSNGGSLDEGRLVAEVPSKAKGFSVRTPAFEVVDLGTEFGVEVNREGKDEIHVLRGKVEVARLDSSLPPLRLEAGHAVRAGLEDTQLTEIEVDQARFKHLTKNSGKSLIPPVVLVHYRFGENDDPSQPLLTLPVSGKRPLRTSSLQYIADAVPGLSERAVSLHGGVGDHFESESPLPEKASGWILEAWVRPRTAKNAIVVFNGRPRNEGFGLFLIDGKWAAVCGHDRFLTEQQSSCLPGVWTHLALVRQQNGGMTLWVNGARASVKEAQRLPTPIAESFHVGGCSNLPEYNLDGDIDEVRWSQLLGPFEPSMLLRKIGNW